MLVAEDLNMERLCCPFVNYTLEIKPNREPFWLRMTGGVGVKEFLKMAFEAANYFDPKVAKAAGLDISAKPEIDSVEAVLDATDRFNEQYARTSVSKWRTQTYNEINQNEQQLERNTIPNL